jgi:hypothetical protein
MLRCLLFSICIFVFGCNNAFSEIKVESAKWIDDYEVKNNKARISNNKENSIYYKRKNFIVSNYSKDEIKVCDQLEQWAKSNLKNENLESYRFFYNHKEITLDNSFFYNDFDYLIADNILCEMDGNLKCYSCNKEVE